MNLIEINIDELKSEFVLSGNLTELFQNRRAKFYFIDFLRARLVADKHVTIPYVERKNVLNKIRNALVKYGIPSSDSTAIKEVLSQFLKEEENFRAFSEKAKRISKGGFDNAEFDVFVKAVRQNFPNRNLYPIQLLAAFHLAFSQNACNFSVPGAGKTSVVYGAYSYLKNLPATDLKHVNKLLIIGPLSSFGPWEDEYRECFGREVYSKRLSGGVSRTEKEAHLLSIQPIDNTPELTLLSYQSIASSFENLKYFLSRPGNDVMVVLDEAHKIKNVGGGIWADAVLRLAKYCSARVVLTGTPIPNGYEDIYNLYEFIWPEKDIINFNVFQLKEMSTNRFDQRIDRLIDDISPFFIRIKKSDVLPSDKFPVINHTPDIIEMGPVQREIYELIENRYIGYFEDNLSSLAATTELTKARFVRLMQAATNPALLQQPLERYYSEEGLGNEIFIDDGDVLSKILHYKELEPVPKKFELIKQKVTEIIEAGEKVILWGTFIRNIKELQSYLEEGGVRSELLIGEVPVDREDFPVGTKTREEIIRRFHKSDSDFQVIIANPFAVAESISLHKACHHAIYFERTFNAANFIQSKDRIHRVGLQENTETHYHYILSANSIDETIHQRLIEKETRMLELIESNEIPLLSENLNFDIDLDNDVKAIIRDYVKRATKA